MKKKILVVGPSWLGDMIMAQAMLKILKKREDCQIDVLAPAWSLPIISCMPYEVSNAIEMPITHGQFGLRDRYKLGLALRKHNYDQAIILPNSWKSALIPFFAKIPLRTGWRGECRWGIINDLRYLDKQKLPLMVQQYAALAETKDFVVDDIPLPKLEVDSKLVADTCTQFDLTISNQPILALCPGASGGNAKRWPEEYYADIAIQKFKQGWQIWLFGSAQDAVITDIIQKLILKSSVASHNFAGKLILPQTVALLSLASAVVSNDSGLMHLAASLDRPLIGIFGPTSPAFTPPLSDKAKVIYKKIACSPCMQKECHLGHKKCMFSITSTEVLAEIKALDSSQGKS